MGVIDSAGGGLQDRLPPAAEYLEDISIKEEVLKGIRLLEKDIFMGLCRSEILLGLASAVPMFIKDLRSQKFEGSTGDGKTWWLFRLWLTCFTGHPAIFSILNLLDRGVYFEVDYQFPAGSEKVNLYRSDFEPSGSHPKLRELFRGRGIPDDIVFARDAINKVFSSFDKLIFLNLTTKLDDIRLSIFQGNLDCVFTWYMHCYKVGGELRVKQEAIDGLANLISDTAQALHGTKGFMKSKTLEAIRTKLQIETQKIINSTLQHNFEE